MCKVGPRPREGNSVVLFGDYCMRMDAALEEMSLRGLSSRSEMMEIGSEGEEKSGDARGG